MPGAQDSHMPTMESPGSPRPGLRRGATRPFTNLSWQHTRPEQTVRADPERRAGLRIVAGCRAASRSGHRVPVLRLSFMGFCRFDAALCKVSARIPRRTVPIGPECSPLPKSGIRPGRSPIRLDGVAISTQRPRVGVIIRTAFCLFRPQEAALLHSGPPHERNII